MKLDIPIWAKALILLAVFGALYAWDQSRMNASYDRGYKVAEAAAKVKADGIDRQHMTKQADAFTAARNKEDQLRKERDEAEAKRFKENQSAKTTIEGLRADARRSELKLRDANARASRPVPGCSGSQGADPSTGSGAEEGSDLMPATADALLGIAGGIAQSVQDYNQLLDDYNTAVSACKKAAP